MYAAGASRRSCGRLGLKGLASLSAITVEFQHGAHWSSGGRRCVLIDRCEPGRSLVRLAVLERKEQRETMAYMGFQTLGRSRTTFRSWNLPDPVEDEGIGLSPKKPLSLQPAEEATFRCRQACLHGLDPGGRRRPIPNGGSETCKDVAQCDRRARSGVSRPRWLESLDTEFVPCRSLTVTSLSVVW